jgi:hypothetical protein
MLQLGEVGRQSVVLLESGRDTWGLLVRRQGTLRSAATIITLFGILGVAESDVMASLDSGDLKGRRIGTQWRVTRAAVDSFLKG